MAVELLETLKDATTAYTGLSPTTFFTVVALGFAVYYAFSGESGGSSEQHSQRWSLAIQEDVPPLAPPVQLGEISEEELKAYDGKDPKKPLLVAIKGQIYDVTQSRMFYGRGGPYAVFAGKDASRALAKMSFEEKYLNGDVTDLDMLELDSLQEWEDKFMSKYVRVGSIRKSKTAPETSTADPPAKSAADQTPKPTAAAADHLKVAEDIPSENTATVTNEESATTS